MLSKDHFVLSIFSDFILFSWLFFQNPFFFFAITFGVFIGCLLPDTDLPKSRIDYLKGITGFFVFITKNFINPLVAIIFEFVLKKPIDRGHRGITHTIYGILTYCLIIEGIGLLLFFVLRTGGFITGYSLFVFGLFFGGMLHLMEDSCTKSGITPFYPLNGDKKYSGNVSTFNLKEKRPVYYAILLLILSVFLLIVQIFSDFPIGVIIFLSVVSFLIAWKIITTMSKVTRN